jgi:tetratricopeptide (TPR) repeat protein
MVRWISALFLVSLAAAWQQPPAEPPADQPPQKKLETQRSKPKAGAQEEIPPEEDKELANQEYSFNPLQSQKDVAVGNQYFKNHKFRAAEMRYTSATKWNDGNADAWLRLGEVAERLKDTGKAKEAYQKYVELASDSKKAAEIRKKIDKLK